MHRTHSSAGFSLLTPLILLLSSLLKIAYYPGTHYAPALLAQSLLMLLVQSALLHVALRNRPNMRAAATPDAGILGKKKEKIEELAEKPDDTLLAPALRLWKPAPATANTATPSRFHIALRSFWRWRAEAPYWQFLLAAALTLLALQASLRPSLTRAALYTRAVGAAGLGLEAALPLPQMVANARAHSCRGFRSSVLGNWLVGDALKLWFFFADAGDAGTVPVGFKVVAVWVAICDAFLGWQWLAWGDGTSEQERAE